MRKLLFYRIVKIFNPVINTEWEDGIKNINTAKKMAINNLGANTYIYQYYCNKEGEMIFTGKKWAVCLCKKSSKLKIIQKTNWYKYVKRNLF
jgi:hypothetical protein